MLRNLDVVEILVKDWPAAVQWYTEKLALQVSNRDDDEQWCRLNFPEGGSALALWGRSKAALSQGSRYLPIILVSDLEATVKELKKRGVKFQEGIRNERDYRITTLVDCEGNELQLIVYT